MKTPLITCHDCDLLQRRISVPPGSAARCARCGAVLYRHVPNAVERTAALALAGLVLFFIANAFPLLSIRVGPEVVSAALPGAVLTLWAEGEHALSALVALTCIVAPALVLLFLLRVFLPLRRGRVARGTVPMLRALEAVQQWNMMEVFLLGILVTVVKLVKMATVIPGPGVWAFFVLIFLLAAATWAMDTEVVWDRLEDGA